MHNVSREKKIIKQKPTPQKTVGALFLCQLSYLSPDILGSQEKMLLAGITASITP